MLIHEISLRKGNARIIEIVPNTLQHYAKRYRLLVVYSKPFRATL